MTSVELTSYIAIIGSIIAIYLGWRKAPHEEKSLDADTAKTYEEAAALASERANRLEKQLNAVNIIVKDLQQKDREKQLLLDELTGRDAEKGKRLDAVELENKELKERLKIVEDENSHLKEWASRLVTQVKNLGGTPVPMRDKRG